LRFLPSFIMGESSAELVCSAPSERITRARGRPLHAFPAHQAFRKELVEV